MIEDVFDVVGLDAAAAVIAPLDSREFSITFQGNDLCTRTHNDRRILLDAANQIA